MLYRENIPLNSVISCHGTRKSCGYILLKPFSILMLTDCWKSDQCLHGKGNKSPSMSSSSHHKRMGGKSWWRDWIEPVFIPVSPQPQASQGPPGTLRACLGAREREESFGRLEGAATAMAMKIHLTVNNHLCFPLTWQEKLKEGNERGNEGHFDVRTLFMGTFRISIIVFYFILCLQIYVIADTVPFVS